MNVLLDALATFRLQRLLGVDKITDPVTFRIRSEWVQEMLDCRWCRSVWAAAAVVALRRVPGGRAVRDVLALAAVAALISEHLDRGDP